jgi:hypothetical protein
MLQAHLLISFTSGIAGTLLHVVGEGLLALFSGACATANKFKP